MKVVVAGSRSLKNPKLLDIALDEAKKEGIVPSFIVSGGAIGPDEWAVEWAILNKIPWKEYRPNYDAHPGYLAPKIRNRIMAQNAEALIAIWDGVSGGTKDMINAARDHDLKVFVFLAT